MRTVSVLAAMTLMCGCAGSVGTLGQPLTPPENPDGTPRDNCYTDNLWEQQTNAWLQTTPEIHMVFWGSYWLGDGLNEFDNYSNAWQMLGNDPSFYKPMQEYNIGAGSFVGTYATNYDMVAATIADEDIQKELQTEITNGVLPAPNDNSMYVIMLPPNTPSLQCADNSWSAYHHYTSVGNQAFTYQVIQYYSVFNSMNRFISHEIYESATDPNCSSGYWSGSGETEMADYCVPEAGYYLDGYLIQQLWSQDSCMCIPATNVGN